MQQIFFFKYELKHVCVSQLWTDFQHWYEGRCHKIVIQFVQILYSRKVVIE